MEKPEKKRGEVEEEKEGVDGDAKEMLMAVLRRMALCPCKTFLCLIFSGFGFYIALDGKKVSPLSDFDVVDFCCCATYRCSYVRF